VVGTGGVDTCGSNALVHARLANRLTHHKRRRHPFSKSLPAGTKQQQRAAADPAGDACVWLWLLACPCLQLVKSTPGAQQQPAIPTATQGKPLPLHPPTPWSRERQRAGPGAGCRPGLARGHATGSAHVDNWRDPAMASKRFPGHAGHGADAQERHSPPVARCRAGDAGLRGEGCASPLRAFYTLCGFPSRVRILTVLVGDNLPELGTDLVAALASLDVDDLAHFLRAGRTSVGGSSPPSSRSRANASTGQLLFPSEMPLGSQCTISPHPARRLPVRRRARRPHNARRAHQASDSPLRRGHPAHPRILPTFSVSDFKPKHSEDENFL
jgi:hypothetical protein